MAQINELVGPAPIVTATGTSHFGTCHLHAPWINVSAAGLFGNQGETVFKAPRGIIDASGLCSRLGVAVLVGPRPIVLGASEIILGVGALEGPLPIAIARGFTGFVGSVEFIAPSVFVNAYGVFMPGDGSVVIVGPDPIVLGSGHFIPVTKIFLGLCLNLSHFGASEYTDYPFNSFAQFNGELLAAGDGGIFLIGGDSNDGAYIRSRIRTGVHDLWLPKRRKIEEVWMTYRSSREMILMLARDEYETWEREFTRILTDIHENRVKVAKGIKNRFFEFEVRNVAGCDFDIDSMRVMINEVSRLR